MLIPYVIKYIVEQDSGNVQLHGVYVIYIIIGRLYTTLKLSTHVLMFDLSWYVSDPLVHLQVTWPEDGPVGQKHTVINHILRHEWIVLYLCKDSQ
jgi:hypothetical protein